MRASVLVLLPLLLLLPSNALAQPALAGPVIALADDSAWQQTSPAVAAWEGGFVVVWREFGPPLGGSANRIRGRFLDPGGGRVGEPFLVASASGDLLAAPDVALAGDGTAFVVWQEGPASTPAVRARLFDAAGEPLGSAFTVSPYGATPQVAASLTRGFVVVWERGDAGSRNVAFRRYRHSGRAVGPEQLLPTLPRLVERWQPAVASQGNGAFRVAWVGRRRGHRGTDIYTQGFQPGGAPLAQPSRANDQQGLNLGWPAVGLDERGQAFVAWLLAAAGNSAVEARRFNRHGVPVGSPLALDFNPALNLRPAISLHGGGLVIVWARESQVWVQELGFDSDPGPLRNTPISISWRPTRHPPVVFVSSLDAGGSTAAEGLAVFATENRGSHGVFGRQLLTGNEAGRVRFSESHIAVPEDGTGFELEVLRRWGNQGDLDFHYQVIPETATAGVDFLSLPPRPLHFGDKETFPARIGFHQLIDEEAEEDETYRVRLLDPVQGAPLGRPTEVVVEIRDDDRPATPLAAASNVIALGPGDVLGAFSVPPWLGVLRRDSSGNLSFDVLTPEAYGVFTPIVLPHAIREIHEIHTAADVSGNFVLVWRSRPDGPWWGQFFAHDGQPRSAVVPLLESPILAVALVEDTYLQLLRQGAADNEFPLWCETYDLEGHRIGAPRRIDVTPVRRPHGAALVASRGGGSWAVWSLGLPGTERVPLLARRLTATGHPAGPEIVVEPSGLQVDPEIRLSATLDGGFFIAWNALDFGSSGGLYGRRFDPLGRPVGLRRRLEVERAGTSSWLLDSVAAGAYGDALLTWLVHDRLPKPGGPAFVLKAQGLEPSGLRAGSNFVVWQTDGNGSSLGRSWVVGLADGGFAIVWANSPEAGSGYTYARFVGPAVTD